MARILHVGFNWSGFFQKTAELEPTFAKMGNWIRYANNNWLLWTEYSPEQAYNELRTKMTGNDQVLIVPLDTSLYQYQGWMPQWVWTWIQDKQMPYASFGLPQPPNPLTQATFFPNPFFPPKQ